MLFVIACNFQYFFGYAFFLVTALLYCPISKGGKAVLCSLGKHSMNMWMIHTWFCYYLFKPFIYGFKYPIVIFLVLIILSYLTSFVIEQAITPIERRLFAKNK